MLGTTLWSFPGQRAVWLDFAHKKLDVAIAAAYGWPADLSDDQITVRRERPIGCPEWVYGKADRLKTRLTEGPERRDFPQKLVARGRIELPTKGL